MKLYCYLLRIVGDPCLIGTLPLGLGLCCTINQMLGAETVYVAGVELFRGCYFPVNVFKDTCTLLIHSIVQARAIIVILYFTNATIYNSINNIKICFPVGRRTFYNI